jgi:cyclopropane fatty-acyl-phospholipid synthase-like methyltransferase
MQQTENEINKFYSQTEQLLDRWGGSTRMIHFGYYPDGETKGFDHEQSLIETVRQVAERLALKPGQQVLDAGCGYGGAAVWISKNYGVHIDGISISQLHIDKARAYALQSGLSLPDQLSFCLQDYTKTDLPADSYDAIYAIESVCYAKEPQEFFAEAFRILKPGGRLVILDGFRTRRGLSDEDEALMISWLSGWGASDIDTIDEISQKLKNCNFSEIKFEDMQTNFAPSHKRGYGITNILCPGAGMLKNLGIISDVIYGHIRAARDLWLAVSRGLCVQGVISATKPSSPGT